MKLKYITNLRLPTQKAHGMQIMKMCEKFAELAEVELIIPSKTNYLKEDPFEYYKVKKNFHIESVPSLDLGGKTRLFPKFLFLFDFFLFVASLLLSGKIKKEDVVYTRDYLLLPFLSVNKKIVEIHDIPVKNWFFLRALKNTDLIIAITYGIKKELVSMGIDEKKIIVSPDGVELEVFDIKITKEEARNKLSLPLDKKIVMYSGQLYSWKGADILAKATKYLNEDILTVFVGGTLPWLSDFNKAYGDSAKIKIIPAKKRELVPMFLKSADLLVIPNSGKERISSIYTSPLKLFEYMASDRPIVASDLPSIKEILNDTNANFFEADNEISLADSIKYTFKNIEESEQKAHKALVDVGKYTWQSRAENIIKAIF